MNIEWIRVKDQLPVLPTDADDVYVACIAVMAKFGDIDRSYGYYRLHYNTATGKWENEDNDLDAEDNSDYWWVTHWQYLTKPTNI